MNVIIDPNAGPCPGVAKAIKMVEKNLVKPLTALGEVIHNPHEVERLEKSGLKTISQEKFETDEDYNFDGQQVFVRSHGISQELYNRLENANASIIDGTCGIVKNVQKKIREHYKNGFQIIIVGKNGHAEVKGLNGQCENNAHIILTDDFSEIDFNKKSLLIAQTTISPDLFFDIQKKLEKRIPELVAIDTTCKNIKSRINDVGNFAATVDVMLLVGGSASSNTTMFFNSCKKANENSYRIESVHDIQKSWFTDKNSVGISGSASTPLWQLQEVHDYLKKSLIPGLEK